MNVIYSPSAHANIEVPGSGFYFFDDVNAPGDAFPVTDADHMTAVNLPQGATYSFIAPVTSADENNGTLVTTPAPTAFLVSSAQARQIALITTAYNAAMSAPINYMASTFDASPTSLRILNDAIAASGGAVPSDFAWYDVNNNPISMTFTQMQGLANTIFLRAQPLFVHKQTQKAAILLATTVTAVEGIVW